MALIKFTKNYRDLSTDRGYQFEFFCDKCGNGYQSKFVSSITGIAGSALKAAGSFFGGLLGRAAYSADEVKRMAQGKGRDDAFEKAIEEAKGFFKQCTRCGLWVCPEVCWNKDKGLCANCAPKLHEEIAAAQAEAQVEQVKTKLASENLIKDVDVVSPATVRCPNCDAQVKAGKFCPDCGAKLNPTVECPKCGTQVEAGNRFCPECGDKVQAGPSKCKCGQEVAPGTKFCPNCGNKIA